MTKEEIIAQINTSTEWFPKSYAGYLFGIHIQAMGLSLGSKRFPYAQSFGLVYQNKTARDSWDWFWSTSEMQDKRNLLLDAAIVDRSFAPVFFSEWEKRYRAFTEYFNTIGDVCLEELSPEQFQYLLKHLYELEVEQASYGYVVDAFLTTGTDDWLQQIIIGELGERATHEVITTFTASVFSSFVSDFEMVILRIALAIQKHETEESIASLVRSAERNYFWVRTNYLDYKRVSASDIRLEATKLAESSPDVEDILHAKQGMPNAHRKAKEVLCKTFGVSERLKNVLRIAELFSHIQDRRKECVLRTNTIFYESLALIAQRNNFDSKLIFYTLPEEFFAFLKGIPIDWNLVSRRYTEGILILYAKADSYPLYADEINSKIKVDHLFPKLGAVVELHGSSAFRGKVTGIVRVLRNTKEIAEFKEGEILVANQTTPEFVVAMKKAAAVVTDQGGVTAHAAIISRELKVPCIVGTKNATRILKTGDMVEVDAEKGVVTILK